MTLNIYNIEIGAEIKLPEAMNTVLEIGLIPILSRCYDGSNFL